jgi:uncharacterized coiled-coil DUF342 family protein
MNNLQLLDIVNVLSPIFGGIVGWFVGRRKKNNDFLTELQASIDLLASKNKELIEDVVALREENAKLRAQIEELNRKFEGVKLRSIKTN